MIGSRADIAYTCWVLGLPAAFAYDLLGEPSEYEKRTSTMLSVQEIQRAYAKWETDKQLTKYTRR